MKTGDATPFCQLKAPHQTVIVKRDTQSLSTAGPFVFIRVHSWFPTAWIRLSGGGYAASMRMGTTNLLAGIMAIFCLGATGGAVKPRAGQASNSEIQRSRLSHIRDMAVENKDGETLGHLKDFVVDMGTGEIKYGVVSVRGFLGVRATRKIVPVAILSGATTKKRTLALDVDLRRWKKAPQFRRSELAT